jgi:MoaA/NifB/PqqE/SkfB family radical SAM enzyme
MFRKILNQLKKEKRSFESFQIEISTYCSLDCQMCPKAFFSEQWIFKNMSMETFGKIAHYFHSAKWVHLQGWGEPLENENLIQMVDMAKKANCLASLTTNGMLLTKDISRKLLDAGLDNIVISIAGANGADHERLRVQSNFDQILTNVASLTDLKKRSGSEKPIVRLSYLMTKFNIRSLPKTIPLAAELGVDEVMATNIDYLAGERCNLLRTFYHESPSQTFQDSIDEMHRMGKKMGIAVRTYPLKCQEVLVCEANPPRNAFFSIDGSVAPCVYLRIPKKGDIQRIFQNKEYSVPQTFFGNINDEDFYEIWNKGSYKIFRKVFEDRIRTKFDSVADTFVNMSFAKLEENITKEPPPLHEVCRTCYKAYGI